MIFLLAVNSKALAEPQDDVSPEDEARIRQEIGVDPPTPALPESDLPGCFSLEQRQEIANGLIDLEKCQVELLQSRQLIRQHLLTFDGVPETAWWQEPSVVIGGIVVGVAVGGLLAATMLGVSK